MKKVAAIPLAATKPAATKPAATETAATKPAATHHSSKPIGISAGRRAFLRSAAASAPALAGSAVVLAAEAPAAAPAETSNHAPRYFNSTEWPLLRALVDRLIPPDASGPGALQVGVPEFIDGQMLQPWGYGHLWYMHGPFDANADPLFGYQQPHAPRELYRIGLASFDRAVRQAEGGAFASLPVERRDVVLARMEKNQLAMADVRADVFFGQVLQNTYEGYFCDPVHGGNRNMAAWAMIGFPGARADYMDWVKQYGAQYPLPPISRR